MASRRYFYRRCPLRSAAIVGSVSLGISRQPNVEPVRSYPTAQFDMTRDSNVERDVGLSVLVSKDARALTATTGENFCWR